MVNDTSAHNNTAPHIARLALRTSHYSEILDILSLPSNKISNIITQPTLPFKLKHTQRVFTAYQKYQYIKNHWFDYNPKSHSSATAFRLGLFVSFRAMSAYILNGYLAVSTLSLESLRRVCPIQFHDARSAGWSILLCRLTVTIHCTSSARRFRESGGDTRWQPKTWIQRMMFSVTLHVSHLYTRTAFTSERKILSFF